MLCRGFSLFEIITDTLSNFTEVHCTQIQIGRLTLLKASEVNKTELKGFKQFVDIHLLGFFQGEAE